MFQSFSVILAIFRFVYLFLRHQRKAMMSFEGFFLRFLGILQQYAIPKNVSLELSSSLQIFRH